MRLLVCVDFSPLTDRVVAEATDLATSCQAPVVLLHVARTEPVLTSGGVAPAGGHRVPPADVRDRCAQLEQIAEGLRERGLEVRSEVRSGDPIDETILDEIAAHGATHLVIGSHGHAVVFELLVGSVTQGVLREARIPVIVVPAPREE